MKSSVVAGPIVLVAVIVETEPWRTTGKMVHELLPTSIVSFP